MPDHVYREDLLVLDREILPEEKIGLVPVTAVTGIPVYRRSVLSGSGDSFFLLR